MAPALEIVDLTDDAETSPVKLSGAGNRVQSHPKVKTEVGESSTHPQKRTQDFRVMLHTALNGAHVTSNLEKKDIEFMKRVLPQLSDKDIDTLGRASNDMKRGSSHEYWTHLYRKTRQLWTYHIQNITDVQLARAARKAVSTAPAPGALPVPTDAELNSAVYGSDQAVLRRVLAELCKLSPALKRATVRSLQPNGRFAKSDLARMKTEQAAEHPVKIEPHHQHHHHSAHSEAGVKTEAGPSNRPSSHQLPPQTMVAATGGCGKRYAWMSGNTQDMVRDTPSSHFAQPENPSRPSNPARPSDQDLLLESTRTPDLSKPVLQPSVAASSAVQMSTPRSTVSPDSVDPFRQRQATPYNAAHDRNWEHNRSSLKRKSPSDDEEEESEEEEVGWWVEERKKNDAWKASLCFFCGKRLGDDYFNSKDNHNDSCHVHSGMLKADGKHEEWLGRSRPTWHPWKATKYTLDRYIWDCCGAKGDAPGCQLGQHVNQQVAEKRLRKSNSIARERKKRRTL